MNAGQKVAAAGAVLLCAVMAVGLIIAAVKAVRGLADLLRGAPVQAGDAYALGAFVFAAVAIVAVSAVTPRRPR